jgi:hypothetical protein
MQLIDIYRHSRRDFLRDGRLANIICNKAQTKLTPNSKIPLKKYGDELRQRLNQVASVKNASSHALKLGADEDSFYSQSNEFLPKHFLSQLANEITQLKTQLQPNAENSESEPKYLEDNVVYSHSINSKIYTENTACGGRLEFLETGGYIFKDVLGKVMEVCSRSGDCLNLEYSSLGNLKAFSRVNAKGVLHSCGNMEKHGVIVRDSEGRVRARGENMTVDTLGRLFVHDIKGQYFSVDLLSQMFSERRLVDTNIKQGVYEGKYITAVFAYDGFRMATFFVRYINNLKKNIYKTCENGDTSFRFYGRDGSIAEFRSLDDLQEMKPKKVLAAGSIFVRPEYRNNKQAATCWQAVYEYLSGNC